VNHNALSRRTFLAGLTATSAAAFLAACSTGGGDAAGSGTISFANWQDAYASSYTTVIDAFTKAKKITVKKQADVAFGDYQTRFRTLLSGGQPPSVMRLNDDFLREMSDKKQVLDIKSYMDKSKFDTSALFDNVFSFTDLPAGRSGIAIGTAPRALFYNKTLLDAAGITPPKTWAPDGWSWDDVLGYAKELTKDDQWGILVNKDTGYENTFSVNNGSDGIFSKDGTKFTLASPEGIEAVQWAADLMVKHKVSPPWSELTADQSDLQLFASGKLAMMFTSMGTASYLRENAKDFQWDIAPVPAKVEQKQEGSMTLFEIPTKTKNPDDAWELLSYLASEEAGRIFAGNGAFIPVNKAAAEDVASSASDNGENMAIFAEAATFQASVNSTKATAEAVNLYRPLLERVYTGEATAQEVLSGVKPQIESLLSA
jgi:multiple sugar transport system substrate-binding protein